MGKHMVEIIKETIIPNDNNNKSIVKAQVITKATNSQTVEHLIYFFFGVVEILLVFRLVLKLAGANLNSAFVGLIYGLTGVFNLPFEGIFRRGFTPGLETTSVLEPATIVALIFYLIFAWGIVKLLRILSGEQQVS